MRKFLQYYPHQAELNSQPCETSKIKLFSKLFNYLCENTILYVWQNSEYDSLTHLFEGQNIDKTPKWKFTSINNIRLCVSITIFCVPIQTCFRSVALALQDAGSGTGDCRLRNSLLCATWIGRAQNNAAMKKSEWNYRKFGFWL